jgi:hypothetical protein
MNPIDMMTVLENPMGESFVERVADADGARCATCNQLIEMTTRDITLRRVCIEALGAEEPQQDPKKRVSAEERVDRFKLAQRIGGNDKVEFSPEELVLVRAQINLACDLGMYRSQVVGAAFMVLGGSPK